MSRIDQVKSLFHDALTLSPAVDVQAWLAARCGGDVALLDEVRSLLQAHSEMQRAATPRPAPAETLPTATFGAYRAVELVGRGGMSTVYRARRADGAFEQTAALKIMAGYLAGGEFQRRFETERQLLASLNHNHITRLLDGGISSAGDLYLITEFVEGQTLDRYCDERRLPVEARLRIFLQVCDAVGHAHGNLIVHRDLKPGNIMVNQEGVVKLLDFGTASLTEPGDAVTITRARMLTPRYASPEQLRGGRINTATDIFSLGVVLYELLTGAWPFGNAGSVLGELQRATGQLAAMVPAAAVSEEAAARRSMTRVQLSRLLGGDLGPIVLKALEYDPALRYESARQFANDLRNFLGGRPVLARPQTNLYRARKFARRHWAGAGAAALFVMGLSTAAVVAIQQARAARAEALKAERVSSFLSRMLSSGTRWGKGFTVAQMLDAAEPEIATSWQDDPLTEAMLRTNLGASYTTLQQPERATFELEKALSILDSRHDRKGAATVLWILGQNACVQGRIQDSVRFYRQALQRLGRVGKEAPTLWIYRAKSDLANMLAYASARNLSEAHTLMDQAIALGLRDATVPRGELTTALGNYGRILGDQGKDADAAFRQASAISLKEKLDGPVMSVLQAQMWIAARQLDFATARELARRQYEWFVASGGVDHVWSACAGMVWARFLAETGETSEAVTRFRAAMPVVRQYMPRGNDFLWTPLASASHVLLAAGQFVEAEKYARESLAVLDDAHRDEVDAWRAESLALLGLAQAASGKVPDGQASMERSVGMYRQLGPVWDRAAGNVQAMRSKLRIPE